MKYVDVEVRRRPKKGLRSLLLSHDNWGLVSFPNAPHTLIDLKRQMFRAVRQIHMAKYETI